MECILLKMLPDLSDMILRSSEKLSLLQRAILLSVAYADIFDYPLTAGEIHRYCGLKVPFNDVYAEIQGFRFLSQVGNYYSLPGREALIDVRIRRKENSARLWPNALHYGQAISRVPFVRMVAVTGSLAVNNTENHADIDYFIVTEPDFLWSCRAMVLTVGKFAGLRGFNLCPNYIVSTRALKFQDQNLYVAHELAQMVPLSGFDVYAEIRHQNSWVTDLLPNVDGPPPAPVPVNSKESNTWLRHIIESTLRIPPGKWFERWEMDRKVGKLSHQQDDSGESIFSADVCKGHDQRHQSRTRQLLDSNLEKLLSLIH
jgi:hypothetical protein